MGIAEKFQNFCSNLKMSDSTVIAVASRYKTITKRLNIDYRGVGSETLYSLYVGSYGRGTAINASDIDMLYILPWSVYTQYDSYSGNGQSALLQAVKSSIQKTYPLSEIGGDGQVVQVYFTDGVIFEVVPCFEFDSGSFYYPDSNNGGSWKSTNPRPEIKAINDINNQTNKNLKLLCRMIRAWKESNNVNMGGLLIDTMAARFLSAWQYREKSFLYYDFMTRDFFRYLGEQDDTKSYWCAIGSNQYIYPKGKFAAKATQAYNTALEALAYENKNYEYSANQKWREIYGPKF